MKQYLYKDHEGKYFVVEANSIEDAIDTAVLDGGDIILDLEPESQLSEGIKELTENTAKDFLGLPEIKRAIRNMGRKKRK
jgi:hypothetical protein